MLKFIGLSKRGRQQIRRHGDKWMPVRGSRQVGCLGGVAGIELMSILDRARFWIKVEGDENLKPVERLDNFGNPVPKDVPVVPDNAFPDTHENRINQAVGATSGRTSASGEPNETTYSDPTHSQPAGVTDAQGTTPEEDRPATPSV